MINDSTEELRDPDLQSPQEAVAIGIQLLGVPPPDVIV